MEVEVVLRQRQESSYFDLESSWMENIEGVPCCCNSAVLAQTLEALVVVGCKCMRRHWFLEPASSP